MRKLAIAAVLAGVGVHVATADPTLSFDTLDVEGAVDELAVHVTMKANASKLLACYKTDAKASGPASLKLTILATGKVGRVTATAPHRAIARCLEAAVGKLTFDKPRDGKTARANYTLSYDVEGVCSTDIDAAPLRGGFGGYHFDPSALVSTAPRAATRVRFGKLAIKGGADEGDVRHRLAAAALAVQDCFDERRTPAPTDKATLRVEFKIEASGDVHTVSVTGSDDRSVTACVSSQHKKLTFPASGDVVVVSYPLTFDAAAH